MCLLEYLLGLAIGSSESPSFELKQHTIILVHIPFINRNSLRLSKAASEGDKKTSLLLRILGSCPWLLGVVLTLSVWLKLHI